MQRTRPSPQPPRSSPQRGVDSRARILEAARLVLAERGYSAATMREISARAGVALGLVNYHFKSRRQLLGEVIATSRGHFLGVLDERLPKQRGPGAIRRVLEIVLGLRELMPSWYALCAELDAQGFRDPELAHAAVANKREGHRDVHEYLRYSCAALGVAPPTDLEGLAATLLAAFDGIAVRSLLDPDFDVLGAYQALERMTLAALAPARRPVRRAWDRDPYPDQLKADAA